MYSTSGRVCSTEYKITAFRDAHFIPFRAMALGLKTEKEKKASFSLLSSWRLSLKFSNN